MGKSDYKLEFLFIVRVLCPVVKNPNKFMLRLYGSWSRNLKPMQIEKKKEEKEETKKKKRKKI